MPVARENKLLFRVFYVARKKQAAEYKTIKTEYRKSRNSKP
jgi:hypothetical protein